MIRKYYVTVLLTCSFLFSVQAAEKKEKPPFDSLSNSRVFSGEKEKIEQVVDTWITLLMEMEKNKYFYPSSLKTDQDFDQFFKLLKTADKEKDSAILIKIADVYRSSAERIYEQILKDNSFYLEGYFPTIYDFSVFFDYAVDGNRMDVMTEEWHMALLFLSLAGFSSSNGKGEYIASIERVQVLYDFFRGISNKSRHIFYIASRARFFSSFFGQEVAVSAFFGSTIRFQRSVDNLNDTYFELILPAFMQLSWVRHDVKYSNHPEVPFKYGRILHKAYGTKEKGLSYISLSAERGYLPAIKYLAEYYLYQGGISFHEGEQLMMKYLEGSKRNFTEKVRVIRELFSLNMMRGDSVSDSLQRGVSSLKKSCVAAFLPN